MNRLKSKTYLDDLLYVCSLPLHFKELSGKNILITGATGLIGCFLTDVLVMMNRCNSLDMQITVFCRDKLKAHGIFGDYIYEKWFNIIEGDLSKPFIFQGQYNYIIHGASNNHPVAFANEPVETMKTILLGTMNLLDNIIVGNKAGSRFLLLSTGEVYGNRVTNSKNEENIGILDPMLPRSCYPEAKKAAETLCASYFAEYGLDTRVARLCYIFGATFQNTSSKADVQFLKKALNGENIVLKSKGTQYRSYCYVSDAVSGILYILLNGSKGECYNISNSYINVTIHEFASKLAKEAGVGIVYGDIDNQEGKGSSKLKEEILDSSKLEDIGYRPKISLEEGFRKILNIYKECREVL